MWLAWAEHWGVFPASGILESLLCDHTRLTLYSHVLFGVVHSASLVAQMVKRLPTMRETRVQSLGWEDPLKKEMATHSSILAQRIRQTEEPRGLQLMGSQRVRHN